MPYATPDDLTARLGPDLAAFLADDDLDAAPDTSILTAALDDASAQIDAALSRRYAVPFDPVPERLVRLTVDLAVRHLYLRRREAIPSETDLAYAQALAELVDLATGRAQLHGAAPRTSRLNTESTTRDQPKRFDRENLKPF
jgi:phage gp36-like protein